MTHIMAFAMGDPAGVGPEVIVKYLKHHRPEPTFSIVRTSVDHGTAFDIAGKGVAELRTLNAPGGTP